MARTRRQIVLHLHIRGDTAKITEDFIATGAQVLEIDHKTDAKRLKHAAHGGSCLLGNIDKNLLALGKPEEVQDACRELIESCQTGGGLILGPGCALPPNTPAENVYALVESAKKYNGHVAQ